MITVLSNIDPNTPLGKIRLAAIATNDFTDEQFEKMLMEHEVSSEDELAKILDVVQKNRSELYKQLESRVA